MNKAEKMYEIAANDLDFAYKYIHFMEETNKRAEMSKFVDSKISAGDYTLALAVIDYYNLENKNENEKLEAARQIIEYSNKIKKYKNYYEDNMDIEGKLGYAYYIIKDYNLAEENFKIALKNTIEKEKLAMYNYYMALLKKHTGNLEEYENYLLKSYELHKNDVKLLNEIIDFYEIKGNKKLVNKYKEELKKIIG